MNMTSDNRIEANRRNALKSTGPRTPEGKARSRRNGLKHGLTGSYVVLAGEDGPAIAERIDAWASDLGPRNRPESWLVARAATASVRLDRCVRREYANLAVLVNEAGDAWDEARRAAASRAAADILAEPASAVACLKRSVAGIDWLLGQWANLETQARRDGWLAMPKLGYALRLMGVKDAPLATDGTPASELWGMGLGAIDVLKLAEIEHHFGLVPVAGATDEDRDEAANAALPETTLGPDGLLACIAAEVARLGECREDVWVHLDGPARAAVLDRARFDASPEAALMRRYETSATTDLHRALGQFLKLREVESTDMAMDREVEETGGTGVLSAGVLDEPETPVDRPPVPPGIGPEPASVESESLAQHEPNEPTGLRAFLLRAEAEAAGPSWAQHEPIAGAGMPPFPAQHEPKDAAEAPGNTTVPAFLGMGAAMASAVLLLVAALMALGTSPISGRSTFALAGRPRGVVGPVLAAKSPRPDWDFRIKRFQPHFSPDRYIRHLHPVSAMTAGRPPRGEVVGPR